MTIRHILFIALATIIVTWIIGFITYFIGKKYMNKIFEQSVIRYESMKGRIHKK